MPRCAASAGSLVRPAQGLMHGHLHGRLDATAHSPQLGASNVTAASCWPSSLRPGNVDERKGLPAIASNLFGKLYPDKGYIGKEFARQMKEKSLDVVTRVRKNMKEVVHSGFDQALLRKRSLVETVFDELKNLCQIEHTRHRPLSNVAVNRNGGRRGLLPATRDASNCTAGFS